MAAEAKITIRVDVEGLDIKDYDLPIKFTHSVTPEEAFLGKGIIGATATNLDLGTIAAADLSGVLLIATGTAGTDYVGFLVDDDGTGTPSTDAGNQVLNAGEGAYINTSGGLTASQYIRIKGSASTTGVVYLAFGSHS